MLIILYHICYFCCNAIWHTFESTVGIDGYKMFLVLNSQIYFTLYPVSVFLTTF